MTAKDIWSTGTSVDFRDLFHCKTFTRKRASGDPGPSSYALIWVALSSCFHQPSISYSATLLPAKISQILLNLRLFCCWKPRYSSATSILFAFWQRRRKESEMEASLGDPETVKSMQEIGEMWRRCRETLPSIPLLDRAYGGR